VRRTRGDGVRVRLSDMHAQPLVAIGRSPLLDVIGHENCFRKVADALNAARQQLGLPSAGSSAGVGSTMAREREE
jgi:hypothetical protein